MDKETLIVLRRRIENAYHERKDYPPFDITVFTDRPKYHQYIIKIIDELIDKEG